MEIKADKIFLNGQIYSVDLESNLNIFSAMAVKDGKIIEIADKKGEEALISKYGEESTIYEDLENQVVLPSMADTHVHAPGLAYDVLFNVNLYNASSKEETLQLIRKHVNENPNEEIYYGRGINGNFFSEEEAIKGPSKKHLDEISSKPIVVADFGGNYLWLNTAALKKYNITTKTKAPEGGEVVLDDKNKLWGTIKGEARALVPYQSLTDEQEMLAAKWFQDIMLSYGYTSIFALRPPGTVEPRATLFKIFKELEARNQLFIRVNGGRDMDPNGDVDVQIDIMKAIKKDVDSELIKFTTAKFFIDGVVEGKDAYLLEPYEGGHDRGAFFWNEEKLTYAFERCLDQGFQIHCHTIGDGAVRKTLDCLEKAKEKVASLGNRDMLTHLQLVDAKDIKRMKKGNVIASIQPYWHFKSPAMFDLMEKPLLGDRAEKEYPLNSFFKEDIMVTSSSDYPVTPDPNPFKGIQAGITRNMYNPEEFGLEKIEDENDERYLLWPEERASLVHMIKSFTINSAYAMGMEDVTGSLEKEKSADFIIVDESPFEVAYMNMGQIKVIRTYFKGKEVFKS